MSRLNRIGGHVAAGNRLWPALFFLLAFLAVWEAGVRVFAIKPYLLPAPSQVIITLGDMLPLLANHSKSTILAAVSGLAAAVAVALVLAVLMDLHPWVRQGLYPLLVVSQTVPIISIAPLFIIWFGYGILPKVVVVALVCFFPVVVSLVEGMQSADGDMVNLLRVMGYSRWQVIRVVRFPAALPSFFAGLKIAGTYSVMGAVIGEWLGAVSGLGVFMTRATHAYQLDRVFAAIFIIVLVSLLIYTLIELLARLVMPWYYNERRNN
ncbi:ABC transporter permease [Desulfoscipio gibsoniae]|uniref:ABC-type nitrate/sulfonate/bicarbonate transport system, permease component n=1 Tax=Desulfoscipio gibsoniae DSM 7213 TaxID=767817 RepID=R4KKA9_9FIRM|nr:ABC transporter permease [Desulfoscipio gibsoniae]AGL03084.1 ABC-type nitrate/sulfonate/bicarbonate transport system, permease component [Desulfoscipio gibsoniae DSM 7213]